MEYALEELYRSLKYHSRQLEENLTDIRFKEEAIESLKTSNEKHIAIIKQLEQAVELIKAE